MMRDVLTDGLGLAGVGAVAYGAWLAYPPAGVVVAGLALVALAAALAWLKPSADKAPPQEDA